MSGVAMSSPFPIAILLASYQGERFLAAQLDSIAAQSCANWRLVVSDDGSSDATREILRRFAAAHPDREIELRDGPRRGATRNFLSLLDAVRPGEAVAWCDQDDVWLSDRLACGVAGIIAAQPGTSGANAGQPHKPQRRIESLRELQSVVMPADNAASAGTCGRDAGEMRAPGLPAEKPPAVSPPGPEARDHKAHRRNASHDRIRPAAVPALPMSPDRNPTAVLHVARTTICTADLRPIRAAPLYRRPPGFRNALVQACTPGNTMLIDPAGVALLRQARVHAIKAGVVSHDWWSYLLIAGAGGLVIRDPAQTVLYRQHGANLVGRNDSFRTMWSRLLRLGTGDFALWLRRNIGALQGARSLLTPENAALLDRFARTLDRPGPVAAAELARMGIYRQTRAASAALLAAAATGRLAAGQGRAPSSIRHPAAADSGAGRSTRYCRQAAPAACRGPLASPVDPNSGMRD